MSAMICEVTFHHTSDIEIFCICKQENCVLGLSNDFSLLGSIRPFNLTRLEGSKEKQQDLKWPNFSKGVTPDFAAGRDWSWCFARLSMPEALSWM